MLMPAMLRDTIAFLGHSIGDFLILLLLARFYLQVARVPFRQPIGQFVLALTNWLVLPLRRVIKPIGVYDTSSLLLALLIAYLMHLLLLWISPWPYLFANVFSLLAILAAAVLELLKMSLYLLFAAAVGQAILSWVTPYHPMMPVFNGLTAPFLRPLRRLIPPISGVDITPLILILLIQLCLNIFISDFERLILTQVRLPT
ncbi:YggT family protein [Chitinilyticum litopenaei]|uniref:YggT family protein n=1 Tax=Chitinilyticum litopenaei TaxID=1121276 RepID=UPI0004194AC7|nr:YggT family protein [Chitinilyticum litopenaei]